MTETQETPEIRAEQNGQYHGGRAPADSEAEPAHHARRPMNAFLIFCKRHRSVVRDKYPNQENRAITKILGEWWALLDESEKISYTDLAKEYKDAFFYANPNFKWYKLPAPPLKAATARPDSEEPPDKDHYSVADMAEQTNNNHPHKLNYNVQASTSKWEKDVKKQTFTPGKLADEAQMGGLSSLIVSETTDNEEDLSFFTLVSPPSTPKFKIGTTSTPAPPKKRQFSETFGDADHFYRSDDVSPPSGELHSARQEKNQKLQDALSETTRVFQRDFGASVPHKQNHSVGNEDFTSSTLIQRDDVKHSQNIGEPFGDYTSGSSSNNKNDNTRQQLDKEPHYSSVSSDESQDKECQVNDNMYIYDKNKNAWMVDSDTAPGRSTGRSCKGKRYQEFMACGGLMVNKRQKKEHAEGKPVKLDIRNKLTNNPSTSLCNWNIQQYQNSPRSVESNVYHEKDESDVNFNCTQNIKASDSVYKSQSETDDTGQQSYDDTTSEHSGEAADSTVNKLFKASDFKLDTKIKALPSLSLDKFLQKKRDSKKRKKPIPKQKEVRPRPPATRPYSILPAMGNYSDAPDTIVQPNSAVARQPQTKSLINQMSNDERMLLVEERKSDIIGSKKRKPRKISINRRDVNSSPHLQMAANRTETVPMNCMNRAEMNSTSKVVPLDQPPPSAPDLCALATLAEVAAKSSKIKEDT